MGNFFTTEDRVYIWRKDGRRYWFKKGECMPEFFEKDRVEIEGVGRLNGGALYVRADKLDGDPEEYSDHDY